MNKRFEVTFLEEAKKDFKKLDGSPKKAVALGLKKLESNADKLGEPLHNNNGFNLAGCRKLKFKKIGIRLVYRIVGVNAEIVEVITIGKREDSEVYETADKRINYFK